MKIKNYPIKTASKPQADTSGRETRSIPLKTELLGNLVIAAPI